MRRSAMTTAMLTQVLTSSIVVLTKSIVLLTTSTVVRTNSILLLTSSIEVLTDCIKVMTSSEREASVLMRRSAMTTAMLTQVSTGVPRS
jgi:hypothetical protein